jgi:hypothetical protein
MSLFIAGSRVPELKGCCADWNPLHIKCAILESAEENVPALCKKRRVAQQASSTTGASREQISIV